MIKFNKKETATLNRILGDRLNQARATLKQARTLKLKNNELNLDEELAMKEEIEVLAVFSKLNSMEAFNK